MKKLFSLLKSRRVVLGIILLLALLLRIYKLDLLELFGDELDVGYQAYSLLKTGRDYRGNPFPIYIESFSESRAPLYLYLDIPFVAVFGLNQWGVRLNSVFWGMLDIVFVYLLAKLLFKKEKIALISAFIISIVPWHIHYSRTGFEVTLLFFLVLAGTYCLLRAKNNKKLFIASAVLFGLSFYTYNTANVFVPLLLLSVLILNKNFKIDAKKYLLPGLVLILLLIPLILKILQGSASSRFSQISIFSDQKTIDRIIIKRNSATGFKYIEVAFHNKLISWVEKFKDNYLTSFSPQFLFISGDPNPRHTVPGFGLLYWVLVIPFLIGIIYSVKSSGYSDKLLLSWLVISPVASSLTIDGGNQSTRLFLMLFPLVVFCAIGFFEILENKKYCLLLIIPLLTLSTFSYFHEYLVHYPKDQFRYWHFGYKDILLSLKENQNVCKDTYFNNNHDPFLIRYLFWERVDPKWFLNNFRGDISNEKINQYFEGFPIGLNYFGSIIAKDKLQSIREIVKTDKTCYVAFQEDEIPGDWNLQNNPTAGISVLKLVKDPNNSPYIYLLTKGE